jgi:hypothetical protein
MMVALLALLLLAAIGMGMMFMADTENSVNNNYRDSQKAYFAARAGAEHARLLLVKDTALNASALALTPPQSGVASNMIYLKNPTGGEAIDPTAAAGSTLSANPYLDDQLCWERYNLGLTPANGSCGSNSQTGQLLTNSNSFTATTMTTTAGVNGTDALPFKWVRITAKQNLMGALGATGTKVASLPGNNQQVCWDGTNEVVITSGTCQTQTLVLMPVWELTSLAVTPKVGANPGSRRMVQMEVALNPPLIPPAPISVQAPVNLQGSYQLNAYDNCKCSCATTGNGGHQVTTCTPRAGQLPTACATSAHAIYTQNTVSTTGNAGTTTTSYGNDPTLVASVQNVNPWPNSLNINNLINKYRPGATLPNFSCSGTQDLTTTPATYKDCGTQSHQPFGDYPSGLPIEPTLGTYNSVTEYIPGSVHLTGASGSGILIVDGDLDINGGLQWYGLILVRGRVSFTGGAGGTNLYGAILAGDDVNATNQPQTDTFGGSINFQYDVCALNRLGGSNPPQLLATHEIMY